MTDPPDGTWTKLVTVHPSIQWVKSDSLVDIDTEIEADVELLTDSSYGADADGNRAQSRTWINLVTLKSMSIKIGGRDGERQWMEVAGNQEEIRHHLTDKEFDYVIDCVCDETLEIL